jgi:hypothetical protein
MALGGVRSEERGQYNGKDADPRPDDHSSHDNHGQTLKSKKLFHFANSI